MKGIMPFISFPETMKAEMPFDTKCEAEERADVMRYRVQDQGEMRCHLRNQKRIALSAKDGGARVRSASSSKSS